MEEFAPSHDNFDTFPRVIHLEPFTDAEIAAYRASRPFYSSSSFKRKRTEDNFEEFDVRENNLSGSSNWALSTSSEGCNSVGEPEAKRARTDRVPYAAPLDLSTASLGSPSTPFMPAHTASDSLSVEDDLSNDWQLASPEFDVLGDGDYLTQELAYSNLDGTSWSAEELPEAIVGDMLMPLEDMFPWDENTLGLSDQFSTSQDASSDGSLSSAHAGSPFFWENEWPPADGFSTGDDDALAVLPWSCNDYLAPQDSYPPEEFSIDPDFGPLEIAVYRLLGLDIPLQYQWLIPNDGTE
ncbi:unnamed protein product [Peniophora sp. CBMAI 1063]|nr:unnamed protein product [Peniophora sp. CBMAI 1063]